MCAWECECTTCPQPQCRPSACVAVPNLSVASALRCSRACRQHRSCSLLPLERTNALRALLVVHGSDSQIGPSVLSFSLARSHLQSRRRARCYRRLLKYWRNISSKRSRSPPASINSSVKQGGVGRLSDRGMEGESTKGIPKPAMFKEDQTMYAEWKERVVSGSMGRIGKQACRRKRYRPCAR